MTIKLIAPILGCTQADSMFPVDENLQPLAPSDRQNRFAAEVLAKHHILNGRNEPFTWEMKSLDHGVTAEERQLCEEIASAHDEVEVCLCAIARIGVVEIYFTCAC